MKTIKLSATKRTDFGQSVSRRSRHAGIVPCVIYGNGETLHFQVEEKELRSVIYTPNSYIIEFDIDGHTEHAVIRETQYHPVKDQINHVDFYRVVAERPVSIDIPVELVGNSEGVKMGGKLVLSKRKLTVSGKVANLPDVLEVDVTALELGKSIFVSDLSFEGLTIHTPASAAVCAVRMTRAARGAAAAPTK